MGQGVPGLGADQWFSARLRGPAGTPSPRQTVRCQIASSHDPAPLGHVRCSHLFGRMGLIVRDAVAEEPVALIQPDQEPLLVE